MKCQFTIYFFTDKGKQKTTIVEIVPFVYVM